MKPKRIILGAADHCANPTGDDLGYAILMNVWAYLHYGERYEDCYLGVGTEDFWQEGVEYGTELCKH